MEALLPSKKLTVTPAVVMASNLFSKVGGFSLNKPLNHRSHFSGCTGVPKIVANLQTSKALFWSRRFFEMVGMMSIHDLTWKMLSISVSAAEVLIDVVLDGDVLDLVRLR